MSDDSATPTVDIHYIKSNSYREASCDGAIGSQTPTNKFWVGFYSERLPVPQTVRHNLKVTEEGRGAELDMEKPAVAIETKTGIVRNLEFGIYLSVDTAQQLHDWLAENLRGMKGENK